MGSHHAASSKQLLLRPVLLVFIPLPVAHSDDTTPGQPGKLGAKLCEFISTASMSILGGARWIILFLRLRHIVKAHTSTWCLAGHEFVMS
jgi:hypothetical protein